MTYVAVTRLRRVQRQRMLFNPPWRVVVQQLLLFPGFTPRAIPIEAFQASVYGYCHLDTDLVLLSLIAGFL